MKMKKHLSIKLQVPCLCPTEREQPKELSPALLREICRAVYPAENFDIKTCKYTFPKSYTYTANLSITIDGKEYKVENLKTASNLTIEKGRALEMQAISVTQNVTGGTYTVSQYAANVAEANSLLQEGIKKVTIREVKENDGIVIPATCTAADPG